MEKQKIAVINRRKLVRELWTFCLNNYAGFEVVAEGETLEESVQISKNEQPTVLLLDIGLLSAEDYGISRQIRGYSPDTKLIGVSDNAIPSLAKRIINEGFMGYLSQNSSKSEMFTAITQVSKGEKYLCDEVRAKSIENSLHHGIKKTHKPGAMLLTQRDIEVIMLLKQGLTSRQIADKICAALKTVEGNRLRIYRKLNVRNAAELINHINVHGLI